MITLNKLSNGTAVTFDYSSPDTRIFTHEKLKKNKGFHLRYSHMNYTFRKFVSSTPRYLI